jgi:large subunit ribosomal protein L10
VLGFFFSRKTPKQDMAITKQKKEEIVSKLSDVVKDSSTIVFAKFTGLTVAEQSEVRKALRTSEVGYTVAKKSLMKRAFEAASASRRIEGAMPELEGETAIAFGRDELAPARELAVFAKKFSEHLAFLGGVFGGKFVSRDEILAIAAIPGAETLRGMFAQLINSPKQRFAVVLSKVAEKAAN